jgi:O-antigen ligase
LFPLTGIGLGTYDVVMPAYQTGSFATLLNHAHNQYLHLLAEGGILFAVPLVCALLSFVIMAWRRLQQDQTATVHLRQGALAGLVGLAVLSVFEVALLTPAVMFLAAVCAGIVVRRHNGDA